MTTSRTMISNLIILRSLMEVTVKNNCEELHGSILADTYTSHSATGYFMSMRGLLLILTGFLFLLCPFRLLCLSFMLNTMCQSKKLVLSPQTATYSYHLMYYPYMCSRYGYSIDLLRPVVYVAIIVRVMHCSHV